MSHQKSYNLVRFGVNLFKTKAVIGGNIPRQVGQVKLLADTGASFTIVPRLIISELGYDLTNPIRYQSITMGQGTTPPLPVIRLSWFNCLGQVIDNFDVIAYNIPTNLQVNGLLGMDFFSKFKTVISIHNAIIYFE